MAAFNILRARSDFKSPYFDYAVVSCNLFGDLENTTHWQRFSEMCTFDLFSELPKMITDEEIAEKKEQKERDKLMRLIQNTYIPPVEYERPLIDVYRVWQTIGDTGACYRAVQVMLRDGHLTLSEHIVVKSFMDRFYHVGDFFDQVFQLNYDVRSCVLKELLLIKNEMFTLRNDLDIFFEYMLSAITNYFKTIQKYMRCGLKSPFFDNYFSYDDVFKRKEKKFKEYLLVSLEMLMTQLLADMEEVDDIWAFIIAKSFFEDLMPVDRWQMGTRIKRELLMELKEMQYLFSVHGCNDATVDALEQLLYAKFGWGARFLSPMLEFGEF